MAFLMAPSEAAQQIVDAMNLPKGTVAFTFSMRTGECAMLTIESYIEQDVAEELATILKRYRLEEIEDTKEDAA